MRYITSRSRISRNTTRLPRSSGPGRVGPEVERRSLPAGKPLAYEFGWLSPCGS